MDFVTPPMFDILNIQTWKVKMSMYLKALSIHIYLATIKDSYFVNGKFLEANVKAIHAPKLTLNDDHLSRISNFDSAFVVWNTLVSLGEQKQYYMRSDLDDGSDDDPLKVYSESELEDIDMPYDELASFYQKLLEK